MGRTTSLYISDSDAAAFESAAAAAGGNLTEAISSLVREKYGRREEEFGCLVIYDLSAEILKERRETAWLSGEPFTERVTRQVFFPGPVPSEILPLLTGGEGPTLDLSACRGIAGEGGRVNWKPRFQADLVPGGWPVVLAVLREEYFPRAWTVEREEEYQAACAAAAAEREEKERARIAALQATEAEREKAISKWIEERGSDLLRARYPRFEWGDLFCTEFLSTLFPSMTVWADYGGLREETRPDLASIGWLESVAAVTAPGLTFEARLERLSDGAAVEIEGDVWGITFEMLLLQPE